MASGFIKSIKKVFHAVRESSSVTKPTNEGEENSNVDDEVNGYLLSVKDSNLIHSYDLSVHCRLVCVTWKRLVENYALKYKAERECRSRLNKGILSDKKITSLVLEWPLYYWILRKDIFGRNLLKNNCGQDQFKYWTVIENGGDKFAIETPPFGADPLPDSDDFNGYKSCFVTSYQPNIKMQIIDLYSEGLVAEILDRHQPSIVVSEWYAGRFDCGCVYNLYVQLLDKRKKVITEKEETKRIKQWDGREWHLTSVTFNKYGPGVRYLSFRHGGSDSQFWAGRYGAKFAGGTVIVNYSP